MNTVTAGALPRPGRAAAAAGPLRVLVGESRPVYRAGVSAAVGAAAGMWVVAEVGTGPEVSAAVARHRPDVVLLGVGTGGLTVCREVTARFPGSRVVVLGPPDEDRLVVGAVRAGARGYLRTTAPPAEYAEAVRAVARGRSAFDAGSADAVRRNLAAQRVRDDRLTPRELDVLRLAGRGLSTREIAEGLSLSGTTVKTYLGNVMRKLGASRRAGAVYAGRERGLI